MRILVLEDEAVRDLVHPSLRHPHLGKADEPFVNPKTRRHCETCGKNFRPMTDAQWDVVKLEHDLMSLRHPESLRLAVGKALGIR